MKKILILFLLIPFVCKAQTIKISALPEATSLNSTDLFLLTQGGASKKLQYVTLKTDLLSNVTASEGITKTGSNLTWGGNVYQNLTLNLDASNLGNTWQMNTPSLQTYHLMSRDIIWLGSSTNTNSVDLLIQGEAYNSEKIVTQIYRNSGAKQLQIYQDNRGITYNSGYNLITENVGNQYWLPYRGYTDSITYKVVADTSLVLRGLIAGSNYTASNGDTIIGGDIQMGSMLAKTTTIKMNEHPFILNNMEATYPANYTFGTSYFSLYNYRTASKISSLLSTYSGSQQNLILETDDYTNGKNNIGKIKVNPYYIDLSISATNTNYDKQLLCDSLSLRYADLTDTVYTVGGSVMPKDWVKAYVNSKSLGTGNDTAKYIKVLNYTGGPTPYYYPGIYDYKTGGTGGSYSNGLTISDRNDSIMINPGDILIKNSGYTSYINNKFDIYNSTKKLTIIEPWATTVPYILNTNAAKNDTASIMIVGNNGATKFAIKGNGQIKSNQISAALTDGVPTDAEIDAATSLTPSTAGAGWQCFIKDSNGTGLVYRVYSDGTDWYYVALTKAL